jgi:hypothetical protein
MPYMLSYPNGVLPLGNDSVLIGNDPENDSIFLNDFQASPSMAIIGLVEINEDEYGYRITNQGQSVFYVDGIEVWPGYAYDLKNEGSNITIGHSLISYSWVNDEEPEEVPVSSGSGLGLITLVTLALVLFVIAAILVNATHH